MINTGHWLIALVPLAVIVVAGIALILLIRSRN
jgi:hypothetical protein